MDWITLVERGESTPQNWIRAMNTALDIGLQRARGDYYLIMHSDTIVRRRGWLRRTFLRDASARQLTREPCPRDYCALYRTTALREHGLSFVSKGGYSAGETAYYDLKRLGYESSLIPVPEMMRNMDHIAHATGAILPERKLDRAHTFRKTRRRLKKLFHRHDMDALLADDSLER